MFYSLSYRIWVVHFLFSEVYNSFAHCLNLVLPHYWVYWLLSFQKRFASLCYTSLGQASHRFASINSVTPIIVVNLPIGARNEVLFIITWDLQIILWVTFRAYSLLFLPAKAIQNNFRKFEQLVFCDLWFPVSGFRIPDSGFQFRILVSDSGFRFPGFRVALSTQTITLSETG